MRKRKLLLVTLCLISVFVFASFCLAACKPQTPTQHEHDYSAEWSYNSASHFHACTGTDCDSVKDSETHKYGEWQTEIPATVDSTGKDKRECTVCHYVEYRDTDKLTPSATHEHNWGGWTVTEANKPTDIAEGKATRICTGAGDCDATAADKEYTLPVLTSEDYSKTVDTATCSAVGLITYPTTKTA